MPYYLNHRLFDPIQGQASGLAVNNGFREVWRETSFRTRPPQGIGTKVVPLSVAEPFTWHEAYESLKARNARVQHPGSAFAKDRGHVWTSEKYSCKSQPLVGSFKVSSSTSYPWSVFPYPSSDSAYGLRRWNVLNPASELDAYGALAYTQASPLAEEFSLPAFVGELREGLPNLIPALFSKNLAGWGSSVHSRLKTVRSAGSDYLNVQFGWIPLLNDVISIASALAKASVAMMSMGEIHRWRELPLIDKTSMKESSSVGTYMGVPDLPVFEGFSYGNNASYTTTNRANSHTTVQNYTSRMWFEGNFVRLPKESGILDSHMDRFEWLISTDLTPADLWQIAPWSWLVDWFFDIGGLIDAFQTGTSNRILSTYAYAMREEVQTTTVLLRGLTSTSWNGPRDYSCVFNASRKSRIRANPFGFILNPSVSLTIGQQLILGALGLTKIRS